MSSTFVKGNYFSKESFQWVLVARRGYAVDSLLKRLVYFQFLFSHASPIYFTGWAAFLSSILSCPGPAEPGGHLTLQILADQLTLFQQGGQIMPTTLLHAPPPRIFKYSAGSAAFLWLRRSGSKLLSVICSDVMTRTTLLFVHCLTTLKSL